MAEETCRRSLDLARDDGAYPTYGGQSMVGALQSVLVKKPDCVFSDADIKEWNYRSKIDLEKAEIEHANMVRILKENGVHVFNLEERLENLSDAMFVQDPVWMTDQGALLLRMGKASRQGEEFFIKKKLQDLNIPIFAEIQEPGTVEGGDLLWLDERTLLAGRSYRSNLHGLLQVRDLLQKFGVSTLIFDIPHGKGDQACLHLQSFISLVDVDLAVVYLPLMPAALVEFLKTRKFEMIEVTGEEFENLGSNILAIKPRVVFMHDRCPNLKRRLEEHDIQVFTSSGDEISFKAEGGPTCLTRPLKREKVRDRYGDTNIYG